MKRRNVSKRTGETKMKHILIPHLEGGTFGVADFDCIGMTFQAFLGIRQELETSLGKEKARSIMMRMGYAAGFKDGKSLMAQFPEADMDEHMALGTQLHFVLGGARARRIEDQSIVDLENDKYSVKGIWEGSPEARIYLMTNSKHSSECQCWFLTGYAAGHSSAVAGKRILAVELSCSAQGHKHCTFYASYADVILKSHPNAFKDYDHLDISDYIHKLNKRIDQQNEEIQKLKRGGEFGDLLGSSLPMKRLFNQAELVGKTDAPVYILGESGTGKELLAHALHEHSNRKQFPFIALNCATLNDNLLQSELFGHKKGSFTGATENKKGVFEESHRGTLFLDEIAELSATAQGSLLRVLQEGTVRRLGENTEISVDVRILCASHKNLKDQVSKGEFREDLFYRLNVVQLQLPPLRERREDVLILAHHFLKSLSIKYNKKISSMDSKVLQFLSEHSWPGNVRELKNFMETCVIFSTGDQLQFCPQKEVSIREKIPQNSESKPIIKTDRESILEALEQCSGNRQKAAALLNMSRTTLWRRMKKYGIA